MDTERAIAAGMHLLISDGQSHEDMKLGLPLRYEEVLSAFLVNEWMDGQMDGWMDECMGDSSSTTTTTTTTTTAAAAAAEQGFVPRGLAV